MYSYFQPSGESVQMTESQAREMQKEYGLESIEVLADYLWYSYGTTLIKDNRV